MSSTLGRIGTWTAAVGFVCFSLGFFGPMVFAPGANQGPLLGILITGPLGTLAGFVIGVSRELLGHRTGPVEMIGGWLSGDGLPGWTSFMPRIIATFVAGFLGMYGAAALVRGEGRGAAAAIVIAAAIACYGITGDIPRWFLAKGIRDRLPPAGDQPGGVRPYGRDRSA